MLYLYALISWKEDIFSKEDIFVESQFSEKQGRIGFSSLVLLLHFPHVAGLPVPKTAQAGEGNDHDGERGHGRRLSRLL